jgi:molecular chaperone GrpE
MTENENKKPEKIDMTEFLGAGEAGALDSGEVELLDPGTGAPMQPARGEGQGEPSGASHAEREKYYDLWVRARADFENFKRRIDREREEERAQAAGALAKDLFPVLDTLERALTSATPGDPFHDGVALIFRQLKDALGRAGLEPIEAVGVAFNPVYHEAVITEKTDKFEPNMVLEEVQKGYMLAGRVLRPSLVKVAVRPDEPARPAGDKPAGKKKA